MVDKSRLVMLISGGGSTMEAIVRATRDGRLDRIDPCLVIGSSSGLRANDRAEELGIPYAVVDPGKFSSRKLFGEEILRICRAHGAQMVGQYGWLPRTPRNVIKAYQWTIYNQHPGPLDPPYPGFGGKGMHGIRVHAAVLHFLHNMRKRDANTWHTEVVTQMVHEKYDEGKILFRAQVPVFPSDTPESLQRRAIGFEHATQIAFLQDITNPVAEPRYFFDRPTPYVGEHEVEALKAAKSYAIAQYPHP